LGRPGIARILVVDDSITVAKFTEMALTAEGHEVAFALDGNECMQKLNSRPIDLIILDVVMPGKNGFQICREIKANKRLSHIPIIMLTTKGQDSDRFWGMRQGADAYLVKPCQEQDLIRTVKQHAPVLKAIEAAPATTVMITAPAMADTVVSVPGSDNRNKVEAPASEILSASKSITYITEDRPLTPVEPAKKRMFYATADSGDSFYVFGRKSDQETAREKAADLFESPAAPLLQARKSTTGELPALPPEEMKKKPLSLKERLQESFYRFNT
jgi:DNA-binding response OmpR family regulator